MVLAELSIYITLFKWNFKIYPVVPESYKHLLECLLHLLASILIAIFPQ